eukprot:2196285-Pleurochrysis_carterae.AAC.1
MSVSVGSMGSDFKDTHELKPKHVDEHAHALPDQPLRPTPAPTWARCSDPSCCGDTWHLGHLRTQTTGKQRHAARSQMSRLSPPPRRGNERQAAE